MGVGGSKGEAPSSSLELLSPSEASPTPTAKRQLFRNKRNSFTAGSLDSMLQQQQAGRGGAAQGRRKGGGGGLLAQLASSFRARRPRAATTGGGGGSPSPEAAATNAPAANK